MAKVLCARAYAEPVYYVVNDMIGVFPCRAVGVTLHRESIGRWIAERAAGGHPPLDAVWCNHKGEHITRLTKDWRGSVGLQAVEIALKVGERKIILCGVPMLPQAGHYRRRAVWKGAIGFRPEWTRHRAEIAPYVRSYSGWTRELLGYPSEEFLHEQHPALPAASPA